MTSEIGWNCTLYLHISVFIYTPHVSSSMYNQLTKMYSLMAKSHPPVLYSSLRNERKTMALFCCLLVMWSWGNISAFPFLCFLFQLSHLLEFGVSFLRSPFPICLKMVKAIPTNRHNFCCCFTWKTTLLQIDTLSWKVNKEKMCTGFYITKITASISLFATCRTSSICYNKLVLLLQIPDIPGMFIVWEVFI